MRLLYHRHRKIHVVVTQNSRLYFAKTLTMIINSNRKRRKYMAIVENIILDENVVIGAQGLA